MAHTSFSLNGVVKSMGLVFGDIGTSPIYSLTAIFLIITPTQENVMGILSLIIFTGLLIFAALLSIILIGIPVFLALLVTGFVIWVFGRLAVFYFFGESLLRALRARSSPAIGAVLLGLVVVSLIAFLPLFGFLVTAVLNIIGWGVVIRTKFGTTRNWFDRKPVAAPPAPPTA